MKSAYALVVLGLAVLVAVAAGASAQSESPTNASALVASVSVPGGGGGGTERLVAPPTVELGSGGWAYPGDGSIVNIVLATGSAVAQHGASSSAQSVLDLNSVVLFGGDVVVQAMSVRAAAAAGTANATADFSSSSVTGLSVLGQPYPQVSSQQIPLADWGTMDVLTGSVASQSEPQPAASGSVTGLRIKLVSDHAGLPAGSEIVIGTVEATAEAEVIEEEPEEPQAPPPSVSPTSGAPAQTGTAPAVPTAPIPTGPAPATPGRPVAPVIPPDPVDIDEPGRSRPGGAPTSLVKPVPAGIVSRLSAGGYVFPVFGPASHGNSFGAPRGAYVSGWHHGEDIFASLGTPLLAVADGTIFSVGWNQFGGWRLWLRDRLGNQFYYAHLSAYSPLAVNGREVRAGDVIGFAGATGDTSSSHLHFEIHPVNLLALGYDGVVAPYPFLIAWRRAQDISFDAGLKYLPDDGPTTRGRNVAPQVGAVLLEAADISSASGLEPGALERTLNGGEAAAPSMAVPSAG